MDRVKRILAGGLALCLMAGLVGCDEEGTSVGGGNGDDPTATSGGGVVATTTDPDDNASTDKETQVVNTDSYKPSGNAGTVKFLGFYDIHGDQKGVEQSLIFEGEQYGGTIEYSNCGSSLDYLDKLSVLISADDSPDITTYEVFRYPGTVSQGMFEPLDKYINKDAAMWDEVRSYIESFEYGGKYYFYPVMLISPQAVNYSRKTIQANDLEDPYDLYVNGEWTWDKFRELMVKFVSKDGTHMGFYANDAGTTPMFATTGTKVIDARPDGTIVNNINDPNITRTMSFWEQIHRDGLATFYETSGYISPADWAKRSDEILFLLSEPEWTYMTVTGVVQNPTGVEDDIFDEISEFAFVPFPRDPESDQYYQAIDSWGFVVPKGAKNIEGAVEMINCWRVYQTDPDIQAKAREAHIHPETITFTSGKYEGMRKWVMTWDPVLYDLWRDMCGSNKFVYVFDNAAGFNDDFYRTYAESVCDVAHRGDSWAQKSAEIAPVLEAILNEYRK